MRHLFFIFALLSASVVVAQHSLIIRYDASPARGQDRPVEYAVLGESCEFEFKEKNAFSIKTSDAEMIFSPAECFGGYNLFESFEIEKFLKKKKHSSLFANVQILDEKRKVLVDFQITFLGKGRVDIFARKDLENDLNDQVLDFFNEDLKLAEKVLFDSVIVHRSRRDGKELREVFTDPLYVKRSCNNEYASELIIGSADWGYKVHIPVGESSSARFMYKSGYDSDIYQEKASKYPGNTDQITILLYKNGKKGQIDLTNSHQSKRYDYIVEKHSQIIIDNLIQ